MPRKTDCKKAGLPASIFPTCFMMLEASFFSFHDAFFANTSASVGAVSFKVRTFE
jgi:hypothetical protein